ncbi:MAG: gamma-glutamylcyclotransferase [Gammaproteobacteria bacterium]|nr:gamma-glutamylcyclotransferase [Gammaproteobacteria bacterium]
MLRVLLWKIGCELAHVKRALWPQYDRKVYYFAFGANLCQEVLDLRRIKVFESFDYVLDNACLRFSQPGFYKDHGYASADAADGEVVYGRIYLILERDALRMDYFEGVPYFEVHEKVTRQADGFEFYFYRATRMMEGLMPTREYLDYIVDAYQQMPAVPADYLDAMRATEVLENFDPSDETGVFVSDITRWPSALQPLLVAYERLCLKLVEAIWHRSPLQWIIRI